MLHLRDYQQEAVDPVVAEARQGVCVADEVGHGCADGTTTSGVRH